ncbi:hypothetical protein K9U39_09895 [Rhodoblastus acidophilus]|uniref:DUF4332 domain-containing protein n=1 Tax=Candidatus Rhodoblastus alkanivorans TaxID=2954117 RepID=A0ABS9Z9A1_9HYPH|nr:hypothetical protein [Candidatus Rhodoblastus alkanivorans]MCI4679480.1 hypothetical protein [Candidatus Rhodoblastus alkanivorans]MCI4683925.1 hypothetical protein [Candidatus Rhodoblastus alkanivorans]MDI4641244.1 hypothetical protein [Rhodoblastus acidophilus]
MIFLLQRLSAWAFAAAALGFVCGLLACRGREKPHWRGFGLALAFALGLGGADALDLAPGRYGLWLEAGLMVLACYLLGSGAGCLPGLLLAPHKKAEPPEWVGAAREAGEWAEAFVAAAPAAIAANDAALACLASSAAAPAPEPAPVEAPPEPELSPPAPPAPADIPPPPAPPAPPTEDFAAIRGLDRRSAQGLRALGVNDLASLAALPREGRKAAAVRLGLDEEVIDYWAAQAHLLAHGVTARPAGAEETADRLDAGAARALSAGLPQIVAAQTNDALYPGERPFGVLAALGGGDDLTRIAGIDEADARRLHALGIWTFSQIAAWSADHARWVEFYLAEPGRVRRQHWREQARKLAARPSVTL